MAAAGRKESNTKRFEPARGKPVVARATLYFLLAHEGKIDTGRYRPDAINMLIEWANSAAPTKYERHRNETIFAIQGNRNPLIDFPEWTGSIAFAEGLG